MRTIEIVVKRTIQTAPYESSAVEVRESIQAEEEDAEEARLALYSVVTKAVTRYVKNEKAKYSKDE